MMIRPRLFLATNAVRGTLTWAALHLLSKFLYFNNEMIRSLLKSMYQNLFRVPLVHDIRRGNKNTLDATLIEAEYQKKLMQSRFIGMGNPSESGCHLLYYFRQENQLKKSLFIHGHEIFSRNANGSDEIKNRNINRYVFLDDFCGTGVQGVDYSINIVSKIKSLDDSAKVFYYPLIATDVGLGKIRDKNIFDKVETVIELDNSFRCFSKDSRFFLTSEKTIKSLASLICVHYGHQLFEHNMDCSPLGFGKCQLLIGLQHNTPDNTLPIFWANSPSFQSIFHRYQKVNC